MMESKLHNNFSSLSEVVDFYQRLGYSYSFLLDDKIELPQNWCIERFYRFEGATNPSDSSIVYLLQKRDGLQKGILVDAYGIYSSDKISGFIKKVLKCDVQKL
jgi:hypothetical protein